MTRLGRENGAPDPRPRPGRAPLLVAACVGAITAAGCEGTRAPEAALESVATCSEIAFTSDRDGHINVYVMDADGSQVRQLTHHTGDRAEYGPTWSPDGTRIAFVSYDRGWHLSTMRPDGTDAHGLSEVTQYQYVPEWSPDGAQIAYVQIHTDTAPYHEGDLEIYVMDADGQAQRRLTNDSTSTVEWGPTWAPFGDRVAFTSNRDGNFEIHVTRLDGSGTVNLTRNGSTEFGASWSPDGSRIAFYSNRSGGYGLYVMTADGTSVQLATDVVIALDGEALLGLMLNELSPAVSWSPDGSRLAYVSGETGDYEIYSSAPDGTVRERLTSHASSDASPEWCRAG